MSNFDLGCIFRTAQPEPAYLPSGLYPTPYPEPGYSFIIRNSNSKRYLWWQNYIKQIILRVTSEASLKKLFQHLARSNSRHENYIECHSYLKIQNERRVYLLHLRMNEITLIKEQSRYEQEQAVIRENIRLLGEQVRQKREEKDQEELRLQGELDRRLRRHFSSHSENYISGSNATNDTTDSDSDY